MKLRLRDKLFLYSELGILSPEADLIPINIKATCLYFLAHSVTGQVTLCPTTEYPPSGQNAQPTSFRLFPGGHEPSGELGSTDWHPGKQSDCLIETPLFHSNPISFPTLLSSVAHPLQWICLYAVTII